jgi:ATP-dependent Clp protease protease subunit
VNEIRKIKRELYEIISQHTNQPVDKVAADCDRDYWMTSTEAKEYGLVDEVLINNPRKNKKD